jgi:hypothetical protein
MLRFATADGTHSGRIVPLDLTRYRWPAKCGKLFEYASGEESGWIVRPTRGCCGHHLFPANTKVRLESSKPVRRGSPTLGRFDSGAAPFRV